MTDKMLRCRLVRQDYPETYDNAYTRDHMFRNLARGCEQGNPEAMWRMGRYFDGLSVLRDHAFFPLAAAYWKFMACRAGSEKAKAWLARWAEEHGQGAIPAAMDESRSARGADGKRYHDLGYLRFLPGVKYNVYPADSCGVVQVGIHPGEDDSFEGSLYRLTYYDEFLKPLPVGEAYYHPDCATRELWRVRQPRMRRRAMAKAMKRRAK